MLQILKALADDTRLKIFNILARQNLCAKGIASELNLSEAAVSQHIKVLKECGLIQGRKQGYFKHYQINKDTLLQLNEYFSALVVAQRETCNPKRMGCKTERQNRCPMHRENKTQ